ncbi:MAG: outer membrane beta-barrel protein [Gammaproteobacteria bacterium]|nr:outer membrane beta-barrel protein [Gammaproteobacteria bacterium]
MLIRKLLLMIVATLALSSQSHAQGTNHYFSIQGAFTDLTDLDLAGVSRASPDNGFGLGIALGWEPSASANNRQTRMELEVSFRNNDVDVRTNNLAGTTRSEEIESYAGMVNVLMDFNTDARLQPYIGAGIGIASVEFGNFGVGGGTGVVSSDDTVFAYQFIVGASYGFYQGAELLGKVPYQAEVFAEYRYFGTDDLESNTGRINTSTDYEVNNLLLGLRFRF